MGAGHLGLIVLVGALVGGAQPEIPARGVADRNLFLLTLVVGGLVLLFMMVLVADATVLTWRFIVLMKSGRTLYPRRPSDASPPSSGRSCRPGGGATPARAVDRRADGPGRNTLLDDWIDARLLGEHTAVIGPLIFFPFILLALMIVARSHLFDNWQIGTSIVVMFAGFVLWSLAMAALLNYGAEAARATALQRMQADLLWLKGAGPDYAGPGRAVPGPDRAGPQPAPGRLRAILPAAAGARAAGAAGRRGRHPASRTGDVRALSRSASPV